MVRQETQTLAAPLTLLQQSDPQLHITRSSPANGRATARPFEFLELVPGRHHENLIDQVATNPFNLRYNRFPCKSAFPAQGMCRRGDPAAPSS